MKSPVDRIKTSPTAKHIFTGISGGCSSYVHAFPLLAPVAGKETLNARHLEETNTRDSRQFRDGTETQ